MNCHYVTTEIEISDDETYADARLFVPVSKWYLENNADARDKIDAILAEAAEKIISLSSGLDGNYDFGEVPMFPFSYLDDEGMFDYQTFAEHLAEIKQENWGLRR